MQKQVWNTGQAASSLPWKCRFQMDSGRQVWKKRQAQDQVTQGLEHQARSLNFILWAGLANEGFQQGGVSSECEDSLEGTRLEVGRLLASLLLGTALGARWASVSPFVRRGN